MLANLLVLVAVIIAALCLVQAKGQGWLNWAVFLGFLGLTLSTWKGLL